MQTHWSQSLADGRSAVLQAPWRCVLLGGGGHARVVVEILRSSPGVFPLAVLDRDRGLWGSDLSGVPIRGGDELLPELIPEGANAFVIGVGSTRDTLPRQRLYELGVSHGLTPLRLSHHSAICSDSAAIGAGTVLFPLAVVNAGATIGVNVIVNTGAIVEHDSTVEDHAHIATGARLASAVRVGRGAHIGVGATVRQRIEIGERAVVGAGAVVVKDVPPGTVVVGVPARPISANAHPRSHE